MLPALDGRGRADPLRRAARRREHHGARCTIPRALPCARRRREHPGRFATGARSRAHHRERRRASSVTVTQSSRAEPGLMPELKSAYVRLLEERTGLRLSDRQAQGLDHAAGQLLARTAYTGPLELYNALTAEASRALVDSLAAEVTVGETHFFRIGPQIQALRHTIPPAVIERRSAERRLGIRSAG